MIATHNLSWGDLIFIVSWGVCIAGFAYLANGGGLK